MQNLKSFIQPSTVVGVIVLSGLTAAAVVYASNNVGAVKKVIG